MELFHCWPPPNLLRFRSQENSTAREWQTCAASAIASSEVVEKN